MHPEEIHLWRADLDLEEKALRELRAGLSADELARADRFLRPIDGRRFAAARGVLRRLLGRYLKKPPEELRFVYGEKGKPVLAEGGGFEFSLSHSGDRAAYVLAQGRELGVDLEFFREDFDAEGIARRYFPSVEAARLAALAEPERRREFFRLWTEKEAYAKALGLGLGAIGLDPRADPRFQVEAVAKGPQEFLALAYSGAKAGLRFFDY